MARAARERSEQERALTVSRLDRLLRPRSLAFIGGAAAELAIDASRSFGFPGDMWAVNPRRELRGLPTFASVGELPEAPDAAFVGVDHHAAVEVVRQLAALGAGAAVCHASGFAEAGEAGAALQSELVAAAAGMPIVGPNCYGTLSAPTGAALWPDVHGLARCQRGVALLSQSGNIAVSLTMQRRSLDIAWVMTLGNQADVGISETFEAMAAEPAVTGIGLCMEAVDDVERFTVAAAAAHGRVLPVVALKLGASETSGTIAVTHTASLVGDDIAYEALFRRLGIRRVHALPELLDTLAVLCALGPLNGNRLVSLSCSGGEAALVADRSRGRNLSFAEFASDHADRVSAALDGRVAVTNPLDYHTFIWGDEARLDVCFRAALGAGIDEPAPARSDGAGMRSSVPIIGPERAIQAAPTRFDAALLVIDLPAEGLDRSRWWPTLRAFAAACSASGTPGVVASSLAENLPAEARVRAAQLGPAACGDIDTALSALEAAAAWGRPTHAAPVDSGPVGLERVGPVPVGPECVGPVSVGPEPVGPVPVGPESFDPASVDPAPFLLAPARHTSRGRTVLSEHQAKQRLGGAGIAVPVGTVVAVDQAAAAAAEIGYPVVVKSIGPAHKTETRGVVIGLDAPASVTAVAERLANVGASAGGTSVGGASPGSAGAVLVEQMVTGSVAELLVSVRSAPGVGMLLTLGAGGTLAEVLADTASLLLPVSADDIVAALRSLRAWTLLSGHRGRPAAAVGAVVETVSALGALVRDDGCILEVEINPLMVTPEAAVAADALMVVSGPTDG